MIQNLLARFFPNYESRAWIKESRDFYRDEVQRTKIELEKWKGKAIARAAEIERDREMIEKLIEQLKHNKKRYQEALAAQHIEHASNSESVSS